MSTDFEQPEHEETLERARIEAYSLLGALLRQPPTEELLARLAELQWERDLPRPLAAGLEEVRDSSRTYSAEAAAEEFRLLFVGLGRGEIVPYASWYREGMLKAGPLARLRSDLDGLGIAPAPETSEPEDHAALLCETMALLARETGAEFGAYAEFFREHLAPWMVDFFEDLRGARNAGFYSAVASLGLGVLEVDRSLAGAS
ncbi:MAG: molecular chaperone TorD family protein [Desulfohalobiaceae bacterium]|nr:molecular chaperone TorD family protein [Desulfohalobiaceae bacterium]